MSIVRSLRIKVKDVDVGSLFGMEDGRNYFRFDESYAAIGPARPVLSQLYLDANEAVTAAQLRNTALAVNAGPRRNELPPFFANLLPEGRLRKHFEELSGIDPGDDLALLAYCGEDLPGDITAVNEPLDQQALGRLITMSNDSYEFSSGQLPLPDGVSISGVQPKVGLVRSPGGRYVMRSKVDSTGKHFIGKLPATEYPNMPEVEFSSLELAKAAGVRVCGYDLLPLTDIADALPFEMRDDSRNFLLVHRFDRDAGTLSGRLHMEDMAQVLGHMPQDKYKGTYASIGFVLKERSSLAEKDVHELLRRIKVNELLGNFDAHLKNFSLLYDRQALRCALSPAYDIVAHAVYMGGSGHGLAFTEGQGKREFLGPIVLRQLANFWDMAEPVLASVVRETVDLAMTRWPGLLRNLPLTDAQRKSLLEHTDKNPSVRSWLRRRPVAASSKA